MGVWRRSNLHFHEQRRSRWQGRSWITSSLAQHVAMRCYLLYSSFKENNWNARSVVKNSCVTHCFTHCSTMELLPKGVNWVALAAIAQILSAVVTAFLAVGTFLAARAAKLSAKVAEREFRATRQPVLSLTWNGPLGMTAGGSAVFTGRITSSAPVLIRPISIDVSMLSGDQYEVVPESFGPSYPKYRKANEDYVFAISVKAIGAPTDDTALINVTAQISVPGIDEEPEMWDCLTLLELTPDSGGLSLDIAEGAFHRKLAKRRRTSQLKRWLLYVLKRHRRTTQADRWNPLNLSR